MFEVLLRKIAKVAWNINEEKQNNQKKKTPTTTSKQKHETKKWRYAGTGGEKHGLTTLYPTLPITIMLRVDSSYIFFFLFFDACGNFVAICNEYLQQG